MRKNLVGKLVTIAAVASLAAGTLAGCGKTNEDVAPIEQAQLDQTIADAPVATADSLDAGKKVSLSVFTKGVYANYSSELENPEKHYFYVFSEDSYGYTDDSDTGIGLPFDCKQEEGTVTFTFGGADATEEKLIVTSADNGMVYGYFEGAENRPLVFELLADADPVGFNAQNYMSNGDYVYNDANGWSIKYDPKRFEIYQEGPVVSIVYTGESAGANLVQVTYDPELNGKDKRDAIAKGYGESATTMEAPFLGDEKIQGYWAMVGPDGGGPGLYETAITRDYMDGSLVFESIEHMSGQEELDMEVSDYLSMIIDSITFTTYEN